MVNNHTAGWRSLIPGAEFHFIPPWVISGYTVGVKYLAQFFIRLEIHPNLFTILALGISMAAAVMVAQGNFLLAGLLIALSGTCDMMDGVVARAAGLQSNFGALFDSVLDRYSEVIVFFGICYFFVREDMMITSVVVAAALAGSLMVSYVRARAEGLGLVCKVGMMQRPERITYLAIGCVFSWIFATKYVLIVALWLIAIFANFTALQRLYYVWITTDKGRLAIQPETEETGISH